MSDGPILGTEFERVARVTVSFWQLSLNVWLSDIPILESDSWHLPFWKCNTVQKNGNCTNTESQQRISTESERVIGKQKQIAKVKWSVM